MLYSGSSGLICGDGEAGEALLLVAPAEWICLLNSWAAFVKLDRGLNSCVDCSRRIVRLYLQVYYYCRYSDLMVYRQFLFQKLNNPLSLTAHALGLSGSDFLHLLC